MKTQIEDRAGQMVDRQLLRFALGATGLLLLLAISAAAQETAQTLRKVLSQSGVPVQSADLENLDKPIGGAELNSDTEFVIAYYVVDESNPLNRPLFVHRYDKRQRKWTSSTLPDAPATAQDINVPCLGS